MEHSEFRCLNTVVNNRGSKIICRGFLCEIDYSAYAFPMSQFVIKTRCRRCRTIHFIFMDPQTMKLGVKLIPQIDNAPSKGKIKSPDRKDAESSVIDESPLQGVSVQSEK